jgi:DNA-binding transcriptional regulator YiaG
VRTRAAPSGRSSFGGEHVRLVLTLSPSRRVGDAFEIARILVRAGATPRAAKAAVDDLAQGRKAFVDAPTVAEYSTLQRDLSRLAVEAHRIHLRPVDVKALRARLGISQEAFAGRYGLDVATVRNWEQGRTKPDGPAAALLQLIDRDPDKVVELLAS